MATRDITLTFEDGTSHQYKGVPDNVTPDQVMERVGKEFSGKKLTNIDGGRSGNIDNEPLKSTDQNAKWKASVTGAVMGLTANLAKPIYAGIDYLGHFMTSGNNPRTSKALNTPLTFGQALENANQSVNAIREANPGAYAAGNIVGALATVPITGGGGALAQIGKNAIYGGLSGYNENQDVGQALAGVGVGAVVPSGVKLVGGAIGKTSDIITRLGLSNNISKLKALVDSGDIDALRQIPELSKVADPVAIAKIWISEFTKGAKSSGGALRGVGKGAAAVTKSINQQSPGVFSTVGSAATDVLTQHPLGSAGAIYGYMSSPHESLTKDVWNAGIGALEGEAAQRGAAKVMGWNLPQALSPNISAPIISTVTPFLGGSNGEDTSFEQFLDELRGKKKSNI